tara:strand:+ start:133 stop:756 length:624 start_codon:yes stop_codon:yes gene_type:complete
MSKTLKKYIQTILKNIDKGVEKNRKDKLIELAQTIKNTYKNENNVKIIFICTHNSRRSQFSHAWAYVSSLYFKLDFIKPFSGGTEIDTVNLNVINSLINSGLKIEKTHNSKVIYLLKSFKKDKGINLYSKVYDSKLNPSKHFIAIMTCSDADQMCPVIRGADKKISLPYSDPRGADNTGLEKEAYDQTCSIIAKEMFYLMKQVKKIV